MESFWKSIKESGRPIHKRSSFDNPKGHYVDEYRQFYTIEDWSHMKFEMQFSSRSFICDSCHFRHIQPGDLISLGALWVGRAEDDCEYIEGNSHVHWY